MTYLPTHDDQTNSLCVLFVDSHVDHYDHLLKGLTLSVPAHILDPDLDGVEQIYETLKHYEQQAQVTTIYIVAHGAPGCLYVGDRELSLSTLESYAPKLKTLFAKSNQTPQICLYGCCVAAGDAGEEFVNKLAEMTGAEIAASSSPIGHRRLGGSWHWDKTTGALENPPLIFSEDIRSSWFGILSKQEDSEGRERQLSRTVGEAESIPLIFAGQPTTLNGLPIAERSLIHNADVIRVSEVATTFDGIVIDGLIRAIDTGMGMAYEPEQGELSCSSSGSELLDGLLRVNLQFVKAGTDVEVCLPNLTAQFWDLGDSSAEETAEVVGFSNADSMALVSLATDEDLEDIGEDSGRFNNGKLSYRLRHDAAVEISGAPANCEDSSWMKEDSTYDDNFDSAGTTRSHPSTHDFDHALSSSHDSDYRVTARFKQFTSTDIAYGITQSLCATAVVCGLRLNALKMTRPADTGHSSELGEPASKRQHPAPKPAPKEENKNSPIDVTTTDALSILFIDPHVQDYGRLLTSVRPGVLIHALNMREDGIEQITQVLRDRYQESNIGAIHIVSRSAPGCLYLGTGELNAWTVEGYGHLVSSWKTNALYLYGAHLAAGEAGKALISELSALLDATVLASANGLRHTATGSSEQPESMSLRRPASLSSMQSPFRRTVQKNKVQRIYTHAVSRVSGR